MIYIFQGYVKNINIQVGSNKDDITATVSFSPKYPYRKNDKDIILGYKKDEEDEQSPKFKEIKEELEIDNGIIISLLDGHKDDILTIEENNGKIVGVQYDYHD